MRIQVLICIILSLALNVHCAKSKYNDDEEDRPYEFGFTIDGQQHRHEKKDANGIIQGEFGFITADGVYHVTVYATDENGNFKILSMRNVKISGPLDEPNAKLPDTSQFSKGNPPAPSPPITPNPLSVNPSPPPVQTVTNRPNLQFTTQPTIKPACAGCGYVTHKTPTNKLPFQTPAFQNPKPGTVVIGNDLIESSKPPTHSQGGTYPNSQAPFSKPQGGTYPNSPSQPVQQTFSNYTNTPTQPGQIYPDRPSQVPVPNRETYPKIPQNNPETYPNPPYPSQETYYNTPSLPAGNYPNQPQDNPSYPQIYENNSPNPPQIIPEAPFVSNPIPIKPRPNPLAIQKPNTQNALGFANPTSVTDVPPAGITVANGMINVPNGPPIPIQDKYPNMVDGLPPSISKDDITDILYKFNYTVGFHGHYEKGYKSGAKVGGYFVTDRDGVSRIVTYVADENGYRPKVKFIRLDLTSDLVPKEGTEKQFGLKNFEFVWYPVK